MQITDISCDSGLLLSLFFIVDSDSASWHGKCSNERFKNSSEKPLASSIQPCYVLMGLVCLNLTAALDTARIPRHLNRHECFARYRRREKRTWPTRYLNLYDQPPSPDLTHSLVFISTSRQLCLRDSIHMRGASEGSKPVHIMPREVLDLRQVSDWVVKQACATLV